MMPSQRTAEGIERTEFVQPCGRISGPGRLQSVKQALPTLTGISKNFHNPL
jgi:hypothetical protein